MSTKTVRSCQVFAASEVQPTWRRTNQVRTWLAKLIICAAMLAAICLSRAQAETASFEWAKSFGSSSGDNDYANAVATDSSGNIYVAGTFEGVIDFGTTNLESFGFSDGFVAKFDSAGTCVWAQQGFAIDNGDLNAVTLDTTGNCYVTGASDFQLVVLKLDLTTGEIIGGASFSSDDYGRGNGIALDTNGNCFVVGTFSGTLDFITTNVTYTTDDNAFLVKLDADFNALWAWQGAAADDLSTYGYGVGVAADAVGNCYITGDFSGTFNLSITNLTSLDSDVYAAKFDTDGNVLWAWQSGTSDWAGSDGGIAVDSSNNCVVAGYFQGQFAFGSQTVSNATQAAFVARFDTAGNPQWAWQSEESDPLNGYASTVTTDDSNNSYVTGGRWAFAGGYQVWVSKFDAAGNLLWQLQTSTSTTSDSVWLGGIALLSSNSLVTAGQLGGGPVTFGGTSLASVGSYDVLLTKVTVSSAPPVPQTPTDAVNAALAKIGTLGLDAKVAKQLSSKLGKIKQKLGDGKTDKICKQVVKYLKTIAKQQQKGKLTEAQATALKADATTIRTLLGCS